MHRKDALVLAVALLCGAAAFFLMINFLKKSASPKPSADRFVTAARDIAAGKVIEVSDLTLSACVAQPHDASDLYLQIADPIAKEAGEDIAKGDLIQRSKLKTVESTSESQETALLESVPAGLRVMTISKQFFESVPDMLKEDSVVDILGEAKDERGKIESSTIARGSKILRIKRDEDGGVTSITLTLSPKAAEAVAGALSGKINFALRPHGDATAAPVFEEEEPVKKKNPLSTEIIRGVETKTVAQEEGQGSS